MAGTITDLKNGKYRLRYTYNGKVYSKNVKAQKEKDAQKLLNNFVYEIEHNTNNTSDMYFNDFVTIWIEKYVEKNLSNRTQTLYNSLLKSHITPFFNGYKLNEIKRIDIINFLDSINDKYVKNTLDKYRKCLTTIFNYAIKCELLEHNPALLVTSPKGKDYVKKENVYTLEQAQQLLLALQNEDNKKYIIELALKCGLRRQEILALNKEDFDFSNNSITINKAVILDFEKRFTIGKTKTTSSNRIVYAPKKLMDKFKKFPDGKLFNYDIDYITKWFKKFLERNNLPPVTLHGLRHTHATLLIANGTDYKTVSAILGHSQTSTTMNIYVHKNEENIKQASKIFENMS